MNSTIDKIRRNKLTAVHSFTVFPQDLNYGDTLFGGKVMSEIFLVVK
jgi:acyl-CoA hydrolase